MFDKRHFPYEYECDGCDAAATIEYEDVQDVPVFLMVGDVAEAVEYVMTERRGWSLKAMDKALCPGCSQGED